MLLSKVSTITCRLRTYRTFWSTITWDNQISDISEPEFDTIKSFCLNEKYKGLKIFYANEVYPRFFESFAKIVVNFNEIFNYYLNDISDLVKSLNFFNQLMSDFHSYNAELIILENSYDNYIFKKMLP